MLVEPRVMAPHLWVACEPTEICSGTVHITLGSTLYNFFLFFLNSDQYQLSAQVPMTHVNFPASRQVSVECIEYHRNCIGTCSPVHM